MSPVRIQRQRTKGWRMPEGAVYVGRPSRFGNPFVVGATMPVPGIYVPDGSGREATVLGNRTGLTFRGNGATFLLTGSASAHLSSGFVVGYSWSAQSFTGGSHRTTIEGFTFVGWRA